MDVDRQRLPVRQAGSNSPAAVTVRDLSASEPHLGVVHPPEGAPNVVVVLIDDMGFGASSAFGGPCEMPVAERLAGGGLSYTRFHTTAICSPTRAALLTGRNHHSVGFGHITELATQLPGYTMRRPASAATIARTLACNGYATGAFGKMHQTPRHEVTPVGPFDRWPIADGFQTFYGFMGGTMNHWHPTLHEGTTPVMQPRTPEDGYHLSEDIVDHAIDWIRDTRTVLPNSRFFCYLPFGATHAPFHVGREWVEKYRGRFDHGWNEQRSQTLSRQKELGVVPHNAELTPWPSTIPEWNSLNEEERRAASMLMELYAGFAEHTDAQVGRLTDAIAELGLLDDTLVLYILGDNGASPEGGLTGAVNQYAGFHGVPDDPDRVIAHEPVLGGPETWPHYPVGWALAMDTPYQWMKQVASHYGGTRNGLVVHWPNGIAARGELRHQWHHVIDVVPTILEAAGLPQPVTVDGTEQMPIEGTAMNYSFDGADAPDRHTTQYFEIGGSRAIYHNGWVACAAHRTRPWDLHAPTPFADDVWELYDTTSDWTQSQDIAADHPEILARLQELFLVEAARHNAVPLDDRPLALRRAETITERGTTPSAMRFHAAARRLPQDLVPDVLNSSHTVSAHITVPPAGARGVICAQGGRFSGWALYLDSRGALTYCHNFGAPPHFYLRDQTPLAPGPHEVRYEFDYDGGGLGKGGVATLHVDDRKVAEDRIERTISFLFANGEGFDVGCDLYTTVTDEIPYGDNAFTGKIDWVETSVHDPAPVSGERQRMASVDD